MAKSKLIVPTKTIILSIVIAIVLSAFIIYLIQAVYPSPKYENYCKNIPLQIEKEQNITQAKYYSECQNQYTNARDKYKLIVFIIAVISGLISVSIGILLTLPSVSSGLMLGGTLLTFYGTAIYWSNLSNWFRTVLLGIILGILIWLGYKKLDN